jgi:hypothetical protein
VTRMRHATTRYSTLNLRLAASARRHSQENTSHAPRPEVPNSYASRTDRHESRRSAEAALAKGATTGDGLLGG